MKCRPLTRLRVGPNAPAVAFYDLLADGQANASAWVRLSAVQPLKNDKDAFGKLWVDADTVVANGDVPVFAHLLGRDVDTRRVLATKCP